jgi:N-acylneuraminate cytidylyltransferase
MAHFAVVPVKHRSERVANKNFRPFLDNGKSLLDFKIEQLQESGVYSDIFISSDSPSARECAKRCGVRFLERSARACDPNTSWSEVIVEVVESTPIGGEDALSWCHVTSPLFRDFKKAVSQFDDLPVEYNGLFTVARLNRFILNSAFRPVNYLWGTWHPYSQQLEPYYFVTGSLFMAKKRDFLNARYVIPSRARPLEVSELQSIDIDTELDFEIAHGLLSRPSPARGRNGGEP